jgi:hypothetical protein
VGPPGWGVVSVHPHSPGIIRPATRHTTPVGKVVGGCRLAVDGEKRGRMVHGRGGLAPVGHPSSRLPAALSSPGSSANASHTSLPPPRLPCCGEAAPRPAPGRFCPPGRTTSNQPGPNRTSQPQMWAGRGSRTAPAGRGGAGPAGAGYRWGGLPGPLRRSGAARLPSEPARRRNLGSGRLP